MSGRLSLVEASRLLGSPSSSVRTRAFPLAPSATIVLPASATYAVREQIKRVGGTFNGTSWSVTDEQIATLRDWADTSARRFNKRDTQFGRDWSVVEAALISDSE